VLRCCADDPPSLFSAARSHSRLHQAAVLAASSIDVTFRYRQQPQQQQFVKRVLHYLNNQGQHVSSINLDNVKVLGYRAPSITLLQLPHDKLQGLSSLSISNLKLQLQPIGSKQGVLGSGAPLKQLRLHRCTVLDKIKGRALSALPKLEHVSVDMSNSLVHFPDHALHEQLTYLDLANVKLRDPDGLRRLQGLTRLLELRLCGVNANALQASMLSGMQGLRVLKLHMLHSFELGVLASKPCVQHLELVDCWVPTSAVGQLLSYLPSLQMLTHLELKDNNLSEDPSPPAAAYSALTASSKLQYLDISSFTLPTRAWEHVFPDGRQLPHLQTLVIQGVLEPADAAAIAPEGSRLVSCCPGLQSLSLQGLQFTHVLLAPLTGLSSLQELNLPHYWPRGEKSEGLEVLTQLTGLRCLHLVDPRLEGDLLQLAHLKQLTRLSYRYLHDWGDILAYGPAETFCQVSAHMWLHTLAVPSGVEGKARCLDACMYHLFKSPK
jgi:hypothetical protein